MKMKVLFLLATAAACVWAGIGNVVLLKGQAELKRGGRVAKVFSGEEIEVKDRIRTEKRSRVQVLLRDDTVVTIGPASLFVFEEYIYGDQTDSRAQMRAERGFFRSVTGKIGKLAPERFRISTHSTTIGIRGTDFSGNVSDKKETIICHRGEIVVTIGKKEYVVKAGEQLTLVNEEAKKKGSEHHAFSVRIGSNLSSTPAQPASGDTAVPGGKNTDTLSGRDKAMQTVQQSESVLSADAMNGMNSDIISEATLRDNLAPLEEPVVEFPDR